MKLLPSTDRSFQVEPEPEYELALEASRLNLIFVVYKFAFAWGEIGKTEKPTVRDINSPQERIFIRQL